MRSDQFTLRVQDLDEDAVADFLARGGQIQYGKLHKPRKAEKWQGSSHIGAAGGKGSKGSVSGMGANTNPKGGKPVVSVEEQGINENVPTTHEDPLVVVKKDGQLWTHANLSVANHIHNTDVSAKEIHSGRPAERGNLTFVKSMHHDTEVEKDRRSNAMEQGVAEGINPNRVDHVADEIIAAKDADRPYYFHPEEDTPEFRSAVANLLRDMGFETSANEISSQQGVAEAVDADLRAAVISAIQTIYKGAVAGSEMIDDVADELGDHFDSVEQSSDDALKQAYGYMTDAGADAEGDPAQMAAVAKKALAMLANKEQGVAEGDAEDAAKKIQTPAYQRKAKGGDWKTTAQDLEKAKEVNVSGPEGLAALKKRTGVTEGVRLLGSMGSDDTHGAKIFWDRDWNEFVVRFYDQGVYNQEADYHTDDRQDAVDTAKKWVSQGPVAEAEKVAAHRPGWMLRMDPKLGDKFKDIERRKQTMAKYAGKTADEISAMAAKEIKESSRQSIVKGLVRVQDIVEDRSVNGSMANSERDLIKLIVLESLQSGIEYQDALIALVEFLKQRDEPIEEVGTIAPVAPGQAANAAPAGTTTTSAGQPAAKPISQQGVDALAQMLKSAGLSTSQLSQVMSKARE